MPGKPFDGRHTQQRKTNEQDDKGWHFIRSFSIDSIIQIVGIAVVLGLPMLYWGRSVESRVLTIENFNTASVAADAKRDADTREERMAFRVRMEKIEENLIALKVTGAQMLAGQAAAQAAVQAATAAAAASNATSARH